MKTTTKRILMIAAVLAVLILLGVGVWLWKGKAPAPNGDQNGTTATTTTTTLGQSTENGVSSSTDSQSTASSTGDSTAPSSGEGTTASGSNATASSTSTTGTAVVSGSGSASQSGHTIQTDAVTTKTDKTTTSSSTKSTASSKGSTTSTTMKTDATTTTTSRPTSVTLPTQKHPQTGEVGVRFPCEIPEYDLVIEKLAPYTGMFVEDGGNAQVDEVAMMMVYNDGDKPLEFAQIIVEYENETLLFEVSALPVGERAVVQEKTAKPVPSGTPKSSGALVAHRATMDMSADQISVRDNGNNTLTVTNLTNKSIPTVRVFYKYYMEDQDVFVGGIAFSLKLTRLGAGASVTVQPSHYTSESGRVVMVLTYEE